MWKGIKQHIAAHPELEEREQPTAISAEKNEAATKQMSFFVGFYRQVLPVSLLILFCVFDAVNMYVNLNNYTYNTVIHGFISAIIFICVLFSSLGVKMKNTPVFWFAFIAFLSIANFPQFMSKDEVFSLSNLISSPEHIVIFALSFGGSILVTLLNLFLKEKVRGKVEDIAATIPVKRMETLATKTLHTLYAKIDATNNDISIIEQKIQSQERKLQEKMDSAEQETSIRASEKVEAIQSFDAKQKQIMNMIYEIKTQINELQDGHTEAIEKYRQEIAIHQLIYDYPEKVIYVDIKTITI